MLCWLILAVGVALAPTGATGAITTNVSGTISTNTTWTLANSPYVMTGSVVVASGVTLTIEPGVLVQGNSPSRSLSVNGSLSAIGTAAQPITFTSTSDSAPGQWRGISFGTGAGSSTLKYVNVRYGGGSGISDLNGMVEVSGGTLTVEDSSFAGSSVSGLQVAGGSNPAATAIVRRTKFETDGFVGGTRHGDGINVSSARVIVEDSALWSNAESGFDLIIGSSYTAAPSEITGSSIWDNYSSGLDLNTTGAAALGPDGRVVGKPGNAVYDNGAFTFGQTDGWEQLTTTTISLNVDWSGTYWGPVSYVPCAFETANGHLSYGAPDPNPLVSHPIPRGPVDHDFATGGNEWCGNDTVLTNPPAYELPDLYFDAPPPSFGGLPDEQTQNCLGCVFEDGNIAPVGKPPGENGIENVGMPVTTATGALAETFTDLRLAGPGIPFA